ncbi:MAG: hypothetical protein VW405_10510 [Rhodospirillaceae bacterium]|jgi:hypothetical protein
MAKRQVRTMFGSDGVPFGRRADVLASIPAIDHDRLAWEAIGYGGVLAARGDRLVRFASAAELADALDRQARKHGIEPFVGQLSPAVRR